MRKNTGRKCAQTPGGCIPKNAGIIFSRIILQYKASSQDVATGEALDAFVTLWQDKMADAWYRFYR